jgi:hypothetical protein
MALSAEFLIQRSAGMLGRGGKGVRREQPKRRPRKMGLGECRSHCGIRVWLRSLITVPQLAVRRVGSV